MRLAMPTQPNAACLTPAGTLGAAAGAGARGRGAGEAENAISKFEQAAARHRHSFAVHVLFKRRQP